MTRTLNDAIRAGCELNPVSSHRAGQPGITFEVNRHTSTGRVCSTEIDKGLCPRDCLETPTRVYNDSAATTRNIGPGRRVVPSRARTSYPPRYDGRRIHGEKVVTTGVAA